MWLGSSIPAGRKGERKEGEGSVGRDGTRWSRKRGRRALDGKGVLCDGGRESAVNEELAREPSSTVDLPIPQKNLLTLVRAVIKADNQQANV